jgi:hypothetical protein
VQVNNCRISTARIALLAALTLFSWSGCSKSSSSFADDTAELGGGGSSGTLNCGNGKIAPDEDCEPGDLDEETCRGLRFEDGMLGCDPRTCTYDTSMCTGRLPPTGGSSG